MSAHRRFARFAARALSLFAAPRVLLVLVLGGCAPAGAMHARASKAAPAGFAEPSPSFVVVDSREEVLTIDLPSGRCSREPGPVRAFGQGLRGPLVVRGTRLFGTVGGAREVPFPFSEAVGLAEGRDGVLAIGARFLLKEVDEGWARVAFSEPIEDARWIRASAVVAGAAFVGTTHGEWGGRLYRIDADGTVSVVVNEPVNSLAVEGACLWVGTGLNVGIMPVGHVYEVCGARVRALPTPQTPAMTLVHVDGLDLYVGTDDGQLFRYGPGRSTAQSVPLKVAGQACGVGWLRTDGAGRFVLQTREGLVATVLVEAVPKGGLR